MELQLAWTVNDFAVSVQDKEFKGSLGRVVGLDRVSSYPPDPSHGDGFRRPRPALWAAWPIPVRGIALEELIFDFGLNPQPFGIPTHPIPVNQRIITNFYTAKRMLHALQLTIQRHEATFGVLETDVQKRVRPGVMPQNRQ
jgi:hypothetical protein